MIDDSTVVWRFEESPELRPSGRPRVDFQPGPICHLCGICCKTCPGQFFPDDLGPDEASRRAKARQLLETGDYQIDNWEGDPRPGGCMPRVFYLRPATKHMRGWVFDEGWGGECALLGPQGCTLPYADRPTVCRSLKPSTKPEEGCHGLTKLDLALAWVDDSDWLHQVGSEVAQARHGDCWVGERRA